MPRINLNSDPYELTLYCPFCGECVVSSEGDGHVDPCRHTVCLGIDDPGEDKITDSDIVLIAHEGGPADRDHVFAFREPTV